MAMIETNLVPQPKTDVRLRFEVVQEDVTEVQRLVEATGFFAPHEVDVAVELVVERLSKGDASGYEFVIATAPEPLASSSAAPSSSIAGYVCFGQIPCTIGSYDIYWIVVSPQFQRRGLGRWLMTLAEKQVAEKGGRKIFIDTSGRPEYASTRDFYRNCGYRIVAELDDFYAPNDSKVIYSKDPR